MTTLTPITQMTKAVFCLSKSLTEKELSDLRGL